MTKEILLDSTPVGGRTPVYFIAEIAGNFRNFTEGKRIIKSAISAGCNSIKFQTFEAETAVTKTAMFDMENVGKVQQYKVLKEYQCSKKLQKQIMDYCNAREILAFSAPSHINDIDFLEEIDNPVYKIGSDLACHTPLLKIVAQLNKPIILSTGLCTLEEIRYSVETIFNNGNDQLMLLHCVADYPAKIEEINLDAIKTMQDEFDVPVGYSDHSTGPEISIAAATLGAHAIERHYCHKLNAKGPDAVISSDETEMKYIIDTVRKIELARGDGKKKPSRTECKNRLTNRVSICAKVDIPPGTIIREEMIDIKRPGLGIQPRFLTGVIGKTTRKIIHKDDVVTWDMIQ